MSALSAYLRDRTNRDVLGLTPDERIGLALALGDDDLGLYCAATGESIDRARRRLEAAKAIGRRASRVMDPPNR